MSGLSIAEKLSQKEYSSVTEYERLKEGHVKSVKHLLSDPRFGSDESDISKVYLTEKGVEMFGKILYQRPILKGNEKPKPNAVNEFISRLSKSNTISISSAKTVLSYLQATRLKK